MTRINIPREPIDPGEIVRNAKKISDWKKLWTICWLCQQPCRWTPGEAHHIVGGAHRSDELCNVVYLCRQCHEFVETLEPLSGVRLCLRLKRIWDECCYDKSRIEALFGRRLDQ